MPSITFKVIEAFDIEGRGVVLVGDKPPFDIIVMKKCNAEVITPSGDVLQGIAFKEWLLHRSTSKPDETQVFLIEGQTKAAIPIGSIVTVTQE